MKMFAFLVSVVLFVGSFILFGYGVAIGETLGAWMFAGGIVAVSASLMIPFHLLEKLD